MPKLQSATEAAREAFQILLAGHRALVRAQELLEGMVPVAGQPPVTVVSARKVDLKKFSFARSCDITSMRTGGLSIHTRVVFVIREGLSDSQKDAVHAALKPLGGAEIAVWSFDLAKIISLFNDFLPLWGTSQPRFNRPKAPVFAAQVLPSKKKGREDDDEDDEEDEDEEEEAEDVELGEEDDQVPDDDEAAAAEEVAEREEGPSHAAPAPQARARPQGTFTFQPPDERGKTQRGDLNRFFAWAGADPFREGEARWLFELSQSLGGVSSFESFDQKLSEIRRKKRADTAARSAHAGNGHVPVVRVNPPPVHVPAVPARVSVASLGTEAALRARIRELEQQLKEANQQVKLAEGFAETAEKQRDEALGKVRALETTLFEQKSRTLAR